MAWIVKAVPASLNCLKDVIPDACQSLIIEVIKEFKLQVCTAGKSCSGQCHAQLNTAQSPVSPILDMMSNAVSLWTSALQSQIGWLTSTWHCSTRYLRTIRKQAK